MNKKQKRQHKMSSFIKESYVEVKPILEASYSTVQYTGGLGTAMIPKVILNQTYTQCFI